MPHTDIQILVADFHSKYKMPVAVPLRKYSSPSDEVLIAAAQDLMTRALLMRKHADLGNDVRLQRATLMIEELSEILQAMHDCNMVELADGLGDLTYVVYGTGVAYGVPVTACVREIHGSNMTKEIGKFKPKKSKGYREPDIASVLWKAGVNR